MIKRIRYRLEVPIRWFVDRYVERHPERYERKFHQKIMANIAHQLLLSPVEEHKESDIFLASYPRSGNTWSRNLIAGGIHQVNLQFASPKLLAILMPEYESGYYIRAFEPTFFKTHGLPKPIFKRVIYIVRDGRDAMTSYYHYRRVRDHEETFLELVTRGDLYSTTWHNHVEQWLANPYNAELLVIRYEDLKQNPIQELEKICEFSGVQRSRETLQQAIEQSSFDEMQRREIKYGPTRKFRQVDGMRNVRRGIVGSHKDEMPPEVLERFMNDAGNTLRKLGYLDS